MTDTTTISIDLTKLSREQLQELKDIIHQETMSRIVILEKNREVTHHLELTVSPETQKSFTASVVSAVEDEEE